MEDKHTILIVDDTPENIDILIPILKSQYRIKVAINGPTAIKIANSPQPPDLILLDIVMPGMDGYEVCRELKDNSKTKEIPIIFLSARAEPEKMGEAEDFILKPVDPEILLNKIEVYLCKTKKDHTKGG